MTETIDLIAQAIIDAGYNPATAKPIAKIALDTIVRDKRENCKHPRKNGSGQIGSNGSSKSTWFCPDCGASGKMETPARPNMLRALR